MKDTSHLVALHESLSRERSRLASAVKVADREFRQRCIDSKKREIESHYQFLGMESTASLRAEISDEDLMAELSGYLEEGVL